MKKYFYVKDGLSLGPYSIEELRAQGISAETLVWCEGMPDCVPAREVAELAEKIPPAMPSGACWPPQPVAYHPPIPPAHTEPMPKTWLTESIIALVLGFIFSIIGLAFGIVAVVQANSVERLYSMGNYDQAKAAASNAKMWYNISLIITLVTAAIIIVIFYIGFIGALINR